MDALGIAAAEAALAARAPELAAIRDEITVLCRTLTRVCTTLLLPDGGVPMLRLRIDDGPGAPGGITFWIREDESGDWALLADPDPVALRPTPFAHRLARRLGSGQPGLDAARRLIVGAVTFLPVPESPPPAD
jgi:hypothetical protein